MYDVHVLTVQYVALQNENKLLETNLGSWGGIDCKMHTST